jgi:hypothetical protein
MPEEHVLPNDNYLRRFVPDYYNMLYSPTDLEKLEDPEIKVSYNPNRLAFNHHSNVHMTNDQLAMLRKI